MMVEMKLETKGQTARHESKADVDRHESVRKLNDTYQPTAAEFKPLPICKTVSR